MKESWRSLIALTVACTVAATIFGFGAQVFSWRSVYDDLGREDLIQVTRLFVFVALGVLLAFRGGWRGVLAAIAMATAATTLEWLLFTYSYAWATLDDPAGYADKFGGVRRPAYATWTTYDILGVGISAALAQGLRTMAHVDPRRL
jgi:O-antigen/teichoic acid export membrane protein